MKLLTLKEISQIYGQGYWHWYALLKNGGLRFIQKTENGKLLVDQKDVENWISRNKKQINY